MTSGIQVCPFRIDSLCQWLRPEVRDVVLALPLHLAGTMTFCMIALLVRAGIFQSNSLFEQDLGRCTALLNIRQSECSVQCHV